MTLLLPQNKPPASLFESNCGYAMNQVKYSCQGLLREKISCLRTETRAGLAPGRQLFPPGRVGPGHVEAMPVSDVYYVLWYCVYIEK